jgi:hypothetical protein
MQAAISNSDMDDATKVESAKAVSGMQTNALPPDQMASILLSEMAASKFYVIGFDAGQPKEMLHAMLQWRVDDIVEERNPLSHLVRGDDPVGKEGRATTKGAIAEGQRNSQKASL